MKKIIAMVAIGLIAVNFSFGLESIHDKETRYPENVADKVEESKIFTDYETLYLKVSKDSELNKLEDWESSLSKIWSYAKGLGCSEISYDAVRELLLNPTDLNF